MDSPEAVDLQDEFAARCLMLLSRNFASYSPTHSAHKSTSSTDAAATTTASALHSKQQQQQRIHVSKPLLLPLTNGNKTRDSTGEHSSGSDRHSPSSSDSSLHQLPYSNMQTMAKSLDNEGREEVRAGGGVGGAGSVEAGVVTESMDKRFGTRNRRRTAAAAEAGGAVSMHRASNAFQRKREGEDLLTQNRPDDDDLLLKHRQYPVLSHLTVQHEEDESRGQQESEQEQHEEERSGASATTSLSDHSPFMIARIIADLHRYPQQDPPAIILSSSSRLISSRISDQRRGVQNDTHEGTPSINAAAATGQQVHKQHKHLSSDSHCCSDATFISRSPPHDHHATDSLSLGVRNEAASGICQSCDFNTQDLSATHNCDSSVSNPGRDITLNKMGWKLQKSPSTVNNKRLGDKLSPKRRKKSCNGSIVTASGKRVKREERDLPIDGNINSINDHVSGEDNADASQDDCITRQEKQCKHACAFPGCMKTYGETCCETTVVSYLSLLFFNPSLLTRQVISPEEPLSQSHRYVF